MSRDRIQDPIQDDWTEQHELGWGSAVVPAAGWSAFGEVCEEFIELSYLVSWPDAVLCSCFQLGQDKNTIRCSSPVCDFSLVEIINLVLYLNGSNF